MFALKILVPTAVLLGLGACVQSDETALRVGHFPNVTHAQGLVAHHMSRQEKGWFESRLGPNVEIQWFVYNAGPTAMEAIFANSIDITYVGPNPCLNAHIRSEGKEVRVIAGAANGGAALVVQGDGSIKKIEDFRGKRIATPQFGNTQDVSCRSWFKRHGFKVTKTGGDVLVLPTANPDQLALFKRGSLEGVWTVEPWVSRLEMEAGGKVFHEEKESLTTVLVCSARILREKPALVRKFARAHAELTAWVREHPEEAQEMVTSELTALTNRKFPLELIQRSWKRLRFTSDISRKSFEEFLAAAREVGFLQGAADLKDLVVPLEGDK